MCRLGVSYSSCFWHLGQRLLLCHLVSSMKTTVVYFVLKKHNNSNVIQCTNNNLLYINYIDSSLYIKELEKLSVSLKVSYLIDHQIGIFK